MKTIPFVKSVGAGNDFVIVDNRRGAITRSAARLATLARQLCHRQQGIGADGLLVVEESPTQGDFRMRIFNPDGSEPTMCVNGARCLALFAHARRLARPSMAFSTGAGLIRASVNGGRVRLGVTQPHGWRAVKHLPVAGRPATGYSLNTGVPHIVFFLSALARVDVARWGRAIRTHRLFQPTGTNVNFAKVIDRHHLQLRTYERGVEAETLACGTGSVASAIAASRIARAEPPVWVRTTGGETLEVDWRGRGDHITDVTLAGPARLVYEGRIRI